MKIQPLNSAKNMKDIGLLSAILIRRVMMVKVLQMFTSSINASLNIATAVVTL